MAKQGAEQERGLRKDLVRGRLDCDLEGRPYSSAALPESRLMVLAGDVLKAVEN
jgi:hypothetical protein